MADEGANALNLSRENLNIVEDCSLVSGSQADIGDWQLHLKSMVSLHGNSARLKIIFSAARTEIM